MAGAVLAQMQAEHYAYAIIGGVGEAQPFYEKLFDAQALCTRAEIGNEDFYKTCPPGDITRMKQKALDYLSRDALSHIEMVEVIRRGKAEIFCADENGVLLREKNSGAWMLSADNEAAENMIQQMKKVDLITFHQPFCKKLLTQKFNF